MLGEEGLDLRIAGRLQAQGQLVVGQQWLQRVVAQRRAVAQVGRGVVLGQGALGFVVEGPLLGQGRGGGGLGLQAETGQQADKQGKRANAHGSFDAMGTGGTMASSLVFCRAGLKQSIVPGR